MAPICDDPPTTPCNPSPSDGATDRPLSSNLSWGCGDSQCDLSVTYDVYFGTDSSPDAGELQGSTSSKSWNLPTLNYSTHYYWKIVAKDANGNTTSSIWDFYTEECEIEINNAFLNYRIVPGQDSDYDISIHECNGSWNESSITYNNRPSWQGNVMDTGGRITHGDGSVWMQFHVSTNLVRNWFNNPSSNDGLVIWDRMLNYDPGFDTLIRFYSSETPNGTSYEPYIDLWWEDCSGSHFSEIPITQDAYILSTEPNSPHNYSTLYAGWLDGSYNQGYVGFVKFNVTTDLIRETLRR